jgi:Flp pilus assembly protein TadG
MPNRSVRKSGEGTGAPTRHFAVGVGREPSRRGPANAIAASSADRFGEQTMGTIVKSTCLNGTRNVSARKRAARKRAPLCSESGQNLLELALVTPMLLLLLLGVIEMGRYAYISILVGNAARAGAAYGAQSLAQSVSTTGIKTAADNDFQNNGQNVSTLTVTSSVSCGCDSGGTITSAGCDTSTNGSAGTCASGHWVVTVSVTASGTFSSIFDYPGIPSSITVSRTATMRVNQNGG